MEYYTKRGKIVKISKNRREYVNGLLNRKPDSVDDYDIINYWAIANNPKLIGVIGKITFELFLTDKIDYVKLKFED